jgi:15-cis-phytoene desaturase
VLGGKLAAEVVSERAAGLTPSKPNKEIQLEVIERAAAAKPKDPVGVNGEGAIAFGGGAVLAGGGGNRQQLQDTDPLVLVRTD